MSTLKIMPNNIKVAPSILSANFANLGEEIKTVSNQGADYIHIDVMDGNFVPNITLGSGIIKSIRNYSNLPFDVHLMINNPDNHLEDFARNGADIITIHCEATNNLHNTIKKIKALDKKVGVAISPLTDEKILDYILEDIDLALIMTVNPGFGGQKFMTSQLKKIENISNKISKLGKKIDLEVDGGINQETAKQVIDCGANVLVAGSFIFKNKNYSEAIKKLRP